MTAANWMRPASPARRSSLSTATTPKARKGRAIMAPAGRGARVPKAAALPASIPTIPSWAASATSSRTCSAAARNGFGRGGDAAPENSRYTIEIEFLEAARGGRKRVSLPDGRSLDLTIPEGIDEGQQMRLKGQGAKGLNGQAGDALVEVHIRPHASFTRDGNDIRMEVPVGIHESALGSRISVATVHGPVEVTVPKGASTGATLRLKGKGIKGGDQFVKLRLVMPPKVDPDLERALGEWAKTHGYDPRAGRNQSGQGA